MSSRTAFPVNDAMAVKLWSADTTRAIRDSLDIMTLAGKDSNSIIQIKDDFKKGKGDQITTQLRTRLDGAGFTEGEIAEGNGEALSFYTDKLSINELGHSVEVPGGGTIQQQRVAVNLRDEGGMALSDWWVDRKSESLH